MSDSKLNCSGFDPHDDPVRAGRHADRRTAGVLPGSAHREQYAIDLGGPIISINDQVGLGRSVESTLTRSNHVPDAERWSQNPRIGAICDGVGKLIACIHV